MLTDLLSAESHKNGSVLVNDVKTSENKIFSCPLLDKAVQRYIMWLQHSMQALKDCAFTCCCIPDR